MPKDIPKPEKQKPDNAFFEALPLAPSLNTGQGRTIWEDLAEYGKEKWPIIKPWLAALATDAAAYSAAGLAAGYDRLKGRQVKKMIGGILAAGTVSGLLIATIVAGSTLNLYAGDIASPNNLLNRNNTGTTILDRNGQVLYRTFGAQNRKLVKIDELPPYLIDATLAAEDPEFYDHPGVSWRGTFRAVYNDVLNLNKREGGSTITQQFIKNSLLSPKKSFLRKYQEILLASELERHYTKDEILQMYFNEVYYGQGSRGIEAAAQTYFHKSSRDLSLGESAMLAGLPLGPSRFDPNVDPQTAAERRNFVLNRMEEYGFITGSEAKAAKQEPLTAFAQEIEIRAPHFVFYVLDELKEEYGEELVEKGGITVYSTLDLAKQEIAEDEARKQIERLRRNHATNAGLVALNPKNGEILAMVGSVDYHNTEFGRVNVTLSELQPGSAFKPIAYATAFGKGWNGATRVDDKPLSMPAGDGTTYTPVNYDGKFRGPVLLRRALANSLNIPAVEVIKHAGVQDTIKTARKLGITTLDKTPDHYGVSLVLGGGEVRPLDMAAVYATFANQGKSLPPKAVMKVLDRYGEDITKSSQPVPQEPAIDPRIAYMIVDILSDNRSRTEIFGPNSLLRLSRPAFVKTGTTNDWRDNMTVGGTPDLITSVWVGNNDHSPMLNVDGVTGAAPIWNNFMERALAGTPVSQFERPAGLVTAAVCAHDGGLANPWDRGIEELFLEGSTPTKRCGTSRPAPEQPESSDEDKRDEEEKPEAKPEEKNEPEEQPPSSGGGTLDDNEEEPQECRRLRCRDD